MNNIIEIYDIETLSNCFTYVGVTKNCDEYFEFVIHKDRNDIIKLYDHLKRGIFIQVGFNNENFDYPIIHYLIKNYNTFSTLNGSVVAELLYKEAQRIIHDNSYNVIPDRKKYIQQLDLFLIWHYGNKARMTSLKDLEFAMNMDNIEEMPIHHSKYISFDEIPCILEYNKNDVKATKLFLLTTLGQTDYSLYKGKNKIQLRHNLMTKFKIPCMNYSDVKIGEQLMLNLYSRIINQSSYDIKQLKTDRDKISLKDCIPSWCNIKSKEFKEFLNLLKTTTLYKGDNFNKSILFHNIFFDFGLGGSHGCIESGIYKSDNSLIILDLDVASLYPSIAKSLKLYPEHLGIEFIELYSKFIDDRIQEKKKPKEERDNVLIEGYKLLLNGKQNI